MDEMLKTMLTQLPNLAVAVWMLYSQQVTIKNLLDNQQRLIDKLMTYIDADKDRVNAAMTVSKQ